MYEKKDVLMYDDIYEVLYDQYIFIDIEKRLLSMKLRVLLREKDKILEELKQKFIGNWY